jgi:hypothetical protein
MSLRITSVLLLAGFVLGGCVTAPLPSENETIRLDAVPFVYSAGKQVQTTIGVSSEDWTRIEAFFEPPATTPQEERHRIRYSIAIFEQIAGSQTPTWKDQAVNHAHFGSDGALDCIDESTNTTVYLRVLEQHGLLRYHEVNPPIARHRFFLDIHQTAVIVEVETGDEYVVDSWFRDNGFPPYITTVDAWYDRDPFPADENPPIDVGMGEEPRALKEISVSAVGSE